MGKLKYSFIIPVYHCEKYLEGCISSIQAQDFHCNYEIILVDDGSPDGSGKICDKYAEQYENIRSFHKENGGASSARNYGIERAKGEYLLFIDGDDTVDKCLLSHLEQQEMSEDILVVYGMSFDYYAGNEIEHTEILAYPESGHFDKKQLEKKFDEFFRCNSLSSACNKVFSKKIINEHHIRFDENMNLYEDFEFVLRYLQYMNQVYCIKEGYYHYRLLREENHLKNRVSDLKRLMSNLRKVGSSIDALGMGEETFVQLYLQLLYLHMLYAANINESIKLLMQKIQEDEWLQKKMNKTVELGANEKQLLQCIKENQSKELNKWIGQKRIQMKTKNVLRPFVKTIRKMITK